MLKVFLICCASKKRTYGLRYELTLTVKSDYSVLNKANTIRIAKIIINGFERYIPLYSSSIPQKAILSKQILSKVATELKYVEKSVLVKE